MDFNEYQDFTDQTAIYPKDFKTAISYTALGLNGEAGEYAEKVKKIIRDTAKGLENITIEEQTGLILELGDVLWYIARAARELNVSLSVIAMRNMAKLNIRKERGKLSGSGDNR